MTSKLLAINIPTYERLDHFYVLMNRLTEELASLDEDLKAQVEVNVSENASSVAPLKAVICEITAIRSGVSISFQSNETNVGADRNIIQCCVASPLSQFTWVLGDDDLPEPGSVRAILDYLGANFENVGLLILSDRTYPIESSLRAAAPHLNYYSMARAALTRQPHLLVAHTLISSNIFRTDVFDEAAGYFAANVLMRRLSLSGYFCHMRGIVGGLLRAPVDLSVRFSDFMVFDSSNRVAGDNEVTRQMDRIYYFYYLWLLSELGVRIDELPKRDDMWWLHERVG